MTYFAPWPAWAARLLLCGMAVLIGLMAIPHYRMIPTPVESWIYTDARLGQSVVERVSHGENYYAASAAEQRSNKYPTAPAVAFREPTLVWMLSALRFEFLRKLALFCLMGLTVLLLYRELLRSQLGAVGRIAAVAVFATGLVIAGAPLAPYLYEVWAAFLIAISLVLYRTDRWAVSVLLGLAACLFRELAMPYLWAMAAFALYERRWRELAAWLAAMAVFAALFAVHLSFAGAMHQPGDRTSAGWIHFQGLPFVIVTARWNLLLHGLPDVLVMTAICLSLAGLAGWRDPRTSRAALTMGGYMAAFTVVGRPDTNYWGQLYAPILPVGLMLAPAAMRDLVRRARPVSVTP